MGLLTEYKWFFSIARIWIRLPGQFHEQFRVRLLRIMTTSSVLRTMAKKSLSFAQFHAAVNGNVLVCRKWLQDLLTSTHHLSLYVQHDRHHGSWVLRNTPQMLPISETLSRAPQNPKLWTSHDESNHEPRTRLIHDQHNPLSLQTDEHTPVKHKRTRRRVPSTITSRMTRMHHQRRRDRV